MDTSRERSESRGGRSVSAPGSRVPLIRSPLPISATSPHSAPAAPKPTPRRTSRVSRLPRYAAHFLGYRPPKAPSPASNDPSEKSEKSRPILILPFLRRIPLRLEISILDFIGGFVSILLACSYTYAITLKEGMVLRPDSIPLAIGSLGATAVLLYGLPESPLSTPRNAIGGHFLSALVGISVSLLFSLAPAYSATADNATRNSFSHLTPVAGALSVGISIVVMQLTGTVHPPGGATSLIAALQPNAIALHFDFLLVVLGSVTIMVAWAFIIGNLGRRRYPGFLWTPNAPPAPPVPAPAPTKPAMTEDRKSETTSKRLIDSSVSPPPSGNRYPSLTSPNGGVAGGRDLNSVQENASESCDAEEENKDYVIMLNDLTGISASLAEAEGEIGGVDDGGDAEERGRPVTKSAGRRHV